MPESEKHWEGMVHSGVTIRLQSKRHSQGSPSFPLGSLYKAPLMTVSSTSALQTYRESLVGNIPGISLPHITHMYVCQDVCLLKPTVLGQCSSTLSQTWKEERMASHPTVTLKASLWKTVGKYDAEGNKNKIYIKRDMNGFCRGLSNK